MNMNAAIKMGLVVAMATATMNTFSGVSAANQQSTRTAVRKTTHSSTGQQNSTKHHATKDSKGVIVTGQGHGKTKPKAEASAVRMALKKALRLYVGDELLMKNEETVKDRLRKHTGAIRHETLEAVEKDGAFMVKAKVWVKKAMLAELFADVFPAEFSNVDKASPTNGGDNNARTDAEVVVQASANANVGDSSKKESFFAVRSLVCREAFANAMTKLAAQTGRTEDSLRGATICGINEEIMDDDYTLKLDVVWSAEREDAACRILEAKRAANAADYVPSDGDKQSFANWIGPRQVRDSAGAFHFLGFSATEIGRSKVVSQRNIRRAELDAQAMAARPFMGKDRKMTDVKARFREVFRLQSRHPQCPDLEMFVCGYEVVSLEFPAK